MRTIVARRALVFAALAFAWCLGTAHAQSPPLTLEPGRGDFRLAPHVDVLEDPTGQMGITEITAPEGAARFRSASTSSLNFGVSRSAYWLRFTLIDLRKERQILTMWVLDLSWENLDSVRLFSPDSDKPGTFRMTEVGTRYQRPASVLGGMRPVLPLSAPMGEPTTFYVRIEHEGAMMMPAQVRSVENYLSRNGFRSAVSGFYIGTIFSIAVYNLLLFFALRQRVYVWYVGYLLFGIVYYLSKINVLEESIFFGYPELDARVRMVALSVAALSCFAFARDFLLTAGNAPRLDKLIKGFGIFWAGFTCLIPLLPITFLDHATSIMGIASPVLFLFVGVARYAQGFNSARYFVLAWFFLTVAYSLWSLMHLGVIPASELVPWTVVVISAAEAILLSFALSDRVRVLREEKEEAGQRERRYRTMAITDELTGLNNVRYFRTQLPLEVQRAEKLGLPLSLALMDLDEFKKFNDSHGHPAGDAALRQLGEVIEVCVRERDVACRYGGEEFVIVFPATRAEEALEGAERIRISYEQARRAVGMPHYGATLSIGLAEYRPGERPEDLVERADQALYKAKQTGKNRTVVSAAG